MLTLAVTVALSAVALATGASAGEAGPVPGARAIKVCGAAGDFWPTMTLALDGTSAWVACQEQGRVVKVDTRSGKTVKSVRLGEPVIAVASGFRANWALGSSGTLYRLNQATGKLVRRIVLPVAAAYNIWIGGGSVWVADDRGFKGRSHLAADEHGRRARHRRRRAGGHGFRGDVGVGRQSPRPHTDAHRPGFEPALTHATLGNSESRAPERMVSAQGKLWITGRGVDLALPGASTSTASRRRRAPSGWPTTGRAGSTACRSAELGFGREVGR